MTERVRRVRKHHPHWAALGDWLAVLLATTSFVFIVLWAASPDDQFLTLEVAVERSLTYGIPLTLGMWGIARATRKGSAVPKSMSGAMPYARLGKDGKPVSSTVADDKAGIAPTPLGGDGEQATPQP